MYKPIWIQLLCIAMLSTEAAAQKTILLEALDMNKCAQDTRRPADGEKGNQRVRMNVATEGRGWLNGQFINGLHTRTESRLYIVLDGNTHEFSAEVGVDSRSRTQDGVTPTAEFFVIGDGKILWQSGAMQAGEAEKPLRVKLDGVKSLLLKVTGAPAHVHVDWLNAQFSYSGLQPQTEWSPEIKAVIAETKAFMREQDERFPAPRINGAMKVGVRPQTPFYYPIAVTGKRPLTYRVEGLPEGLSVDLQTGIITGMPAKAGDYAVKITAENASGKAQRTLRLMVGDQLSLTPPIGYQSWNWVQSSICETFMKEFADALVEFGFRDVGYQYVNMDDCWEGARGADGHITVDPVRFPNGMKTIADYLHERGLKFGVYSSPGALTCAGYPGTLGFEKQDVDSWASWGTDYLKYDHCSCPRGRELELATLMGDLLKKSGRTIVYEANYLELHGKEAGCHLWRVGGDIRDTWMKNEASAPSCVGIIESFENAVRYADVQEPGGWNDPDMLVAGLYGHGDSSTDLTDGKGCTDTEYRSQMSLWALMSAPLFISADIRSVNKTTLETLTNPEVIEVNQDALGDFPRKVGTSGDGEVWVKQMEDGSKTVALFNRGSQPAQITVHWKDLALKGRYTVRDLWKRKDMGKFSKEYSAVVQPHEVALVRIFQ